MAKIGCGYGSEWHLLQYLGRRRDAFTRTIEDLTGNSSIHWLDHRETLDGVHSCTNGQGTGRA